jgi:glutathione S-transferase
MRFPDLELAMLDIILHHYPTSPFSEKIRLIFGLKKLAWKSVEIPRILPKPDVIALTGGYRKTPILQIGADIYCDTALIAKRLDELAPSPTLFPVKQAASVLALSQWADSYLFQVAVRLVFQPANLASMFPDAKELDAFSKDRQAMRNNATTRRLSELETAAAIQTFLSDFERQLDSGVSHVAGEELSIADFSVYHCLWFLQRSPGSAKVIEPYGRVLNWMKQVAELGHGMSSELSSAEAVEIAQRATPQVVTHASGADSIKVGDQVVVLPTDYGIDPTPGALVTCTPEEIAIRRVDSRAGEVIVHFPRLQYELRKAS